MKRIILPISVVLVVLAAAIFCGWPGYRRYQEARALRQARMFLAKNDWANASLGARQALQINPRNVEACRVVAQLAQRLRSPAALDWFHRVADLAPIPANKLELIACALRVERPPYPLARRTLLEVEPVAAKIPAFHVLSAELALRQNAPETAALHFSEAARIEPTNRLHRLNLAVVQLQSKDDSQVDRARAVLEGFACDTNLGAVALRWLLAANLQQTNFSAAREVSRRLLAHPGAQLSDRLQDLALWSHYEIGCAGDPASAACLEENRSAARSSYARNGPGFFERLRAIQSGAANDAAEVFEICQWMGGQGLARNGLSWLQSLEPKLLKTQPIPLAHADLIAADGDWTGLETFVTGQEWGDLEFLRLAMLARAAWGQNQESLGQMRWSTAARSAAERLGALELLLGLSAEWGVDARPVLWQIVRRFPRERWAYVELEKRCMLAGNTRELNRLYETRLRLAGGENDWTNQNNFASTSLLLGVNLPRAHRIARELSRRQPDDPILTATYAYSLHLQQRTPEALSLFQHTKEDIMRMPAMALYYGVLLAAAGETERARPYLARADGGLLLPEEQRLLLETKNHLGRDDFHVVPKIRKVREGEVEVVPNSEK